MGKFNYNLRVNKIGTKIISVHKGNKRNTNKMRLTLCLLLTAIVTITSVLPNPNPGKGRPAKGVRSGKIIHSIS
jgi:hypothetical protein